MTTDDVREKAYELITHAIWCSISGTSANAHADDVLAALEAAGLQITAAANAPDPERVNDYESMVSELSKVMHTVQSYAGHMIMMGPSERAAIDDALELTKQNAGEWLEKREAYLFAIEQQVLQFAKQKFTAIDRMIEEPIAALAPASDRSDDK